MSDNQSFTDLEWLEASRAKLLEISKRQQTEIADANATIAEQAEALEGYRSLKAEETERIKNSVTGSFGQQIIQAHIRRATHRLPAHEIAALRERGVEVGEVDGGNDR